MLNKTLHLPFLMLMLSCSAVFGAKQVLQSPVPSWVKTNTLPPTNKVAERDVSDGYYYLLFDEQTHVAGAAHYRHIALNIINDVGVQNASEIELSYDPGYETLTMHYITVKRGGTTIGKLDMKEIKILQRETDLESRIYDGRYSAYINLKDIRKGDIIEYAYTITGRNPVYGEKFFGEFSTEYSTPVTQIQYRLVSPSDRKLQFKQHVTDKKPQISTEGNNTIYEWNMDCIQPKEAEESIPKWFSPFGFVEISEYRNWDEVVAWAVRLYPLNGALSKELKQKITELNTGSTESKVMATLHFVQDEIRYMGFEVGVNSHKPNDPNKVFAQRFGDCKDKALLMCRMLAEMGIEAYPNLVNTNRTKAIAEWLPAPSCFNHVTVCVVIDGRKYWFDQTDSYQAGKINTLQYPQYHKTLLVKAGEKGITDIPVAVSRRTFVYETFVVQDTVSPITLRVVTTYEGSDADNIRYVFSSRGMSDLEKDYTNYYKTLYGDVSLENKIEYTDNQEENIFKVFEEYSIRNMWTITEGRKQIEVGPYVLFNAIQSEDIKTRKMPFALDFPCDYEQTVEVKFPMSIAINEETETIDDAHFKYTRNFSSEGGGSIVLLNYHYRNLKELVEPGQSVSFFTKINELKRLNTYYVSWGAAQNPSQPATANINWLMVVLAVVGTAGFVILCFYLFKKDVVPTHEVEYAQEIGGWLVLVGLSMVISLLFNVYQILSAGYFNLAGWIELTTPGKAMYHPLWSVFLIGELMAKIGLSVFILFLLILFKNRRSSFPYMFIVFVVSNVVYLTVETIMSQALPGVESVAATMGTEWVKMIVYAAIWIPYMLMSWRVKETFVFTYDPALQKNWVPGLPGPDEPETVNEATE